MALESALEGNFSSASDVWSYAVLTFEVFTKGELPYSGSLFFFCKKKISQDYLILLLLKQDNSDMKRCF